MRQKFNSILTLPAVALTLLASGCGKEAPVAPVTGFPEDGVVRVSTAALTKADGEGVYVGDNLGLFMDYGASDSYSMTNVRWTGAASGWASDTQMLWKNSTAPAALYAYAPYVAGCTNPASVMFDIPSDQTSGTVGADFVFWKNEAFVPNDVNPEFVDGKVQIGFSHALVKLTLNFEKANQFASDVTVEKVVLKETVPMVAFNLKSGRIDNYVITDLIDILMHRLDDLRYEAVFYPGNGQSAGNRMLEVTMSDGTILFYNVPAGGLVSGGLKDGESYSMNMLLGKDKIEVVQFAVGGWETGDSFGSSEVEVVGDLWDGSVASSFESGSGTQDDPYIIATSAQLAYLAQSVNGGESYSGKYLKQTSDLVLANRPWTPIGIWRKPFSGSFDGDGKKIYGLNVNSTDLYVGLFGYVENGAVIENCYVRGRVETTGSYAGGIAGELGEGATVAGCTAQVTVKGGSNVGGICGHSYRGSIIRCHTVNCHVEGSNYAIGGIVGIMDGSSYSGKVEECTAEGTVMGVEQVGGICGWLNSTVVVSGCSAHVDISAQTKCGGLVGYIAKTTEFMDCGFDGTITKTGSGSFGAAVGVDKSKATFTGCWYNADKTGDLPAVGASEGDAVGKDYSGIEAKHLGK